MNYDLWADTVRLNNLNFSNALYHWSSNFFVNQDALVDNCNVENRSCTNNSHIISIAFWLQIFTFILMRDNPNDILNNMV